MRRVRPVVLSCLLVLVLCGFSARGVSLLRSGHAGGAGVQGLLNAKAHGAAPTWAAQAVSSSLEQAIVSKCPNQTQACRDDVECNKLLNIYLATQVATTVEVLPVSANQLIMCYTAQPLPKTPSTSSVALELRARASGSARSVARAGGMAGALMGKGSGDWCPSSLTGQVVQCSSLCVADHGAFAVDSYTACAPSSTGCWNNLNGLSGNQACTNLSTSLSDPLSSQFSGCYEEGQQFNIWLNAAGATNSQMAPFAIQVNSSADWCTIYFGGTVDSAVSSITANSLYTPVSLNRLCVDIPSGIYAVSSYNLWASNSCQYAFSPSDNCVNMIDLPACFKEKGAIFNLWVDAVAATNSFPAPYAFSIDYMDSWAVISLGGTVDSISTSLLTFASLPKVPTSGLAICNQGWFDITNYQLWYNVGCAAPSINGGGVGVGILGSFVNTTANLPSLAANNSACFGKGQEFSLLVNAVAATSTAYAPYAFVYDPEAQPLVITLSGTVDNIGFGYLEPAVATSEGWICVPSQYPQSDLHGVGASPPVGVSGCPPEQNPGGYIDGCTTLFPQCNNTNMLNQLLSWPIFPNTNLLPLDTTCNSGDIGWLIMTFFTAGVSFPGLPASGDQGSAADLNAEGAAEASAGTTGLVTG